MIEQMLTYSQDIPVQTSYHSLRPLAEEALKLLKPPYPPASNLIYTSLMISWR